MSSIDRHSLPPLFHPTHAIRNNGSSYLALERYKLRELAEGWPLYRDHCEWGNNFVSNIYGYTLLTIYRKLLFPLPPRRARLHHLVRARALPQIHRNQQGRHGSGCIHHAPVLWGEYGHCAREGEGWEGREESGYEDEERDHAEVCD